MTELTRRSFLRSGAAVAAATAAATLYHPGLAAAQSAFAPQTAAPLPDVVAAKGTSDDSAADILKTALDGLGGISRFVKPGMTVAIKPNATWAFAPFTASSSDPALLAALVQMVKEAGAKRIIVMDHCSIDPGTAEALRINGIGKMVDQLDVEKLFPDRSNAARSTYTQIELPQGKAFKKIGVIKAAVEADLRINLALAKSHNVTKMTMCLKHMMGFLEVPGALHAYLAQGIADLSTPSEIQAQLHILEAIRVRHPQGSYVVCGGPETEKSHPTIVRRTNQILAGVDPVLIDTYGCEKFYEVKPRELAHLKLAAESGVGEMDLEKATADGRFITLTVGQAAAPAAASATPVTTGATPVTTGATPVTTGSPVTTGATPTPLPTATPFATPAIAPEAAAASAGTSATACGEVVSPNAFLSGAMLPAAAVVLGAGAVVARRVHQPEEESHAEPKP